MKTTTQKVLEMTGLVLIVISIYYAYQYPKVSSLSAGINPAGTTYNTAKVASVNIVPSSPSATSSSLTNNDATDRIITDAFGTCEGAGTSFTSVAALNFTMATDTAANGVNTNTYAYAGNFNVSTSSSVLGYTSSSTYTFSPARVWNAGSVLNIFVNATNTASCVAGVHYLAS